MTLIADVFWKLGTPNTVVREVSKKSLFKRDFEMQYGKGSQTLLKSEPEHLYHIY